MINHLWNTYFKTYPHTTVQDFIKFLYQSILGSGHLVHDIEQNYRRLVNEYESLAYDPNHVLYEEISDQLVRVHLEAIKKEDLKMMHRLFMKSMEVTSSLEALLEAFKEVEKGINEGWIPFSQDEWNNAIDPYIQKGCPVTSHSESFRNEYHPHYRLMKKEYIQYLDLFRHIDVLEEKSVIAIDGNSGSGKSSLASLLHEVYDYPIIHMDDFFLQPHQRTESRLNEIGGHVDYERFYEEVVLPLSKKQSFDYAIFDCSIMELHGTQKIEFKDKVIVEGSYSHHPYFEDYTSLKVFLEITPSLQIERIRNRNGEMMLQRFINEWIPRENRYFETFKIKEKADIRIK